MFLFTIAPIFLSYPIGVPVFGCSTSLASTLDPNKLIVGKVGKAPATAAFAILLIPKAVTVPAIAAVASFQIIGTLDIDLKYLLVLAISVPL